MVYVFDHLIAKSQKRVEIVRNARIGSMLLEKIKVKSCSKLLQLDVVLK